MGLELEALEDLFVVLVVDLDLGHRVQSGGEHVGAGALHADDEDGAGAAGHDGIGLNPGAAGQGSLGARPGVEVVLLDQATDAPLPRPLDVPAQAGLGAPQGGAVFGQWR
ncbi:MAG: hypothetical protein KDB28_02420 [Tetrasphaera sp.]|nr:hypothetical protein [Tetrasphaera sp.]